MAFDLQKFWEDFKDQSLAQAGISTNVEVNGTVAAQKVGQALAQFGNKVSNPPDSREDPAAANVAPGSIPIVDRSIAGVSVKTIAIAGVALLALIYFVKRGK